MRAQTAALYSDVLACIGWKATALAWILKAWAFQAHAITNSPLN
jgi:hypothetical protein